MAEQRERGAALMITTLLLVPLMVFAAFGVDLASWYARISDLQRAADAAALAGAVWMPDVSRATTEATASLRSNGIVDNQNGMDVTIARGSTATSLRVTVVDTDATRYFSSIFVSGPERLSRFAEAEYNLPLPLGSPLNYFGGDASKTGTTITTVTVTWPGNYSVAAPTNAPCNVGSAASDGLGRWTSATTFDPGGYSGSTRCTWPAQGPTNAPCNDQQGSGAVGGSWATSSNYRPTTRYTSGTGNRQCTWGTGSPTFPANYNNSSNRPGNRPCNTGDTGRWTSGGSGSWSSGSPTATNPQCVWTATTTSSSSPGPNPIASDRSPGFWAQIHGPGADQQSGDAYSTMCTATTNCSTPNNALYTDPSDPNGGYWYVIHAPAGGGSVTVRIFDAQLTPGALSAGAGDSSISGTANFTTTYRVWRQTNPLDFTSREAPSGAATTADQAANSCNWAIDGQSSFQMHWVDLCTITMGSNDTYLLNVRTATNGSASSAGRNGYAIEACLSSSCTAGAQPSIHAFERMVLYNNVSSGDATFYIAEVGPQYAGRTLVLELFDPGEASGQAWVYAMRPSTTLVRPVVNVSSNLCTITSTRSGYPRSSDLANGGNCSFRSTDGSALYNGHWVTMRIQIPSDYTCTVGVNPETTANSCWWGIRYSFGGAATDTTTWRASIEGNPLQLTQ